MKKLITKIVILAVCSVSFLSAGAQDKGVDHRNYIGATLSELPFLDYRLSYERRLTPEHGLKLEIGYKPAIRYFTDATIINLGQNATGWCYRNTANWYYVSLGYRHYFNEKKTAYLSPELFYKRMTADRIVYSWGLENSDYSRNAFEIRTMETNCYGVNVLIGKRMRIRFGKGFHMGFDMNAGLTFRYKMVSTTSYGHVEVGHYHDEGVGIVSIPISDHPDTSTEGIVQMMVQFGIILFASW